MIYISLFEIGSLISAVAPSSAALIAGRAVMGIGASGVVGGSLAVIGLYVTQKEQPSGFSPSQTALY